MKIAFLLLIWVLSVFPFNREYFTEPYSVNGGHIIGLHINNSNSIYKVESDSLTKLCDLPLHYKDSLNVKVTISLCADKNNKYIALRVGDSVFTYNILNKTWSKPFFKDNFNVGNIFFYENTDILIITHSYSIGKNLLTFIIKEISCKDLKIKKNISIVLTNAISARLLHYKENSRALLLLRDWSGESPVTKIAYCNINNKDSVLAFDDIFYLQSDKISMYSLSSMFFVTKDLKYVANDTYMDSIKNDNFLTFDTKMMINHNADGYKKCIGWNENDSLIAYTPMIFGSARPEGARRYEEGDITIYVLTYDRKGTVTSMYQDTCCNLTDFNWSDKHSIMFYNIKESSFYAYDFKTKSRKLILSNVRERKD